MKKVFVFAVMILNLMALAGCEKEKPAKVSLENKEIVKAKAEESKEKHLRVAVGGMITPREGFVYYRNFLDYIGEKLGMHVDFVDRENYDEINALMKSEDVDIAFVCSGPYVDGHKEFGMELLVAPQAYGETVYYSYIIVHKDSSIKSFGELRGKRFAFTDPKSNTGKLVPTYMLAKMNETPDTFFEKYIFTQSHDKAIKAVAQGIVDGAAVDSLIWEYANRTNPEFTSKTKIIKKSAPYGIPPVTARRGLNPELKEKLRQIFLNVYKDEKGKEILKGMMIDKFVVIGDEAYNSIREMKSWIEKQNMKGQKAK